MRSIRPRWTKVLRDKRRREFPESPALATLRCQCFFSHDVANGDHAAILVKANRDRHEHSSGQLNAKQRELLELQALAQRRLKGVRANFAEGLKTARETKRDLEWTQKRVR